MILVDAQQNIAFNAQQFSREYQSWAWRQRRASAADAPPATTSLRDTLLARIAIVISSITVLPEASPPPMGERLHRYRNDEEARQLAHWQLDYYRRLADEAEQIQLITSRDALDAVLKSWAGEQPLDKRRQGIVMQLKGAAPISSPQQFEEWHGWGLRAVAPGWGQSRYVSSADGGLTRLGFALLEALGSQKALLDIAGMSARAAAAALDRYEGPIFASHGSPRAISGGERCLADAALSRLAERGGVLGIMLYNRFLKKSWHPSDRKDSVTLAHWVDAVDHVCQVTGSAEFVGLGSDIDGGYAYSALPSAVDTSSDLWLLRRALLARGFSLEQAAAILGGNMLRVLRESLADG